MIGRFHLSLSIKLAIEIFLPRLTLSAIAIEKGSSIKEGAMPKKLIHGLTHSELVNIAARWLRNTEKCSVVISELASQAEEPDAIGWKARVSTLVECKATRDDFRRDRQKSFRADPNADSGEAAYLVYNLGMGTYRYYMTPEGLISQDEIATMLPRSWGLLEVSFTGRVGRTVDAVPWALPTLALRRELGLVLSALRRYQGGDHAKA